MGGELDEEAQPFFSFNKNIFIIVYVILAKFKTYFILS